MKESRLNIWGQEGCSLPNAKGRCTSCCFTLAVPELKKREGAECPFANKGCRIYGLHPASCENFHCSKSVPNLKLWLISMAETRGLVNHDEAEVAKDKVEFGTDLGYNNRT